MTVEFFLQMEPSYNLSRVETEDDPPTSTSAGREAKRSTFGKTFVLGLKEFLKFM